MYPNCFSYNRGALWLCLGAIGFLNVEAARGTIYLWQARNGPATSPQSPVEWARGNADPSNSHYAEGHSVPYRMELGGLRIGAHRLIIEWNTKESGLHALDYVTHYDRLAPHTLLGAHTTPERIDPLAGLSDPFAPPNRFPIPSPASGGATPDSQPSASFDALPESERQLTIWNGTITNVTYLAEGDLTANSASTRMAIDFVASRSLVVIAWGGHIASRLDWGAGRSVGGKSGLSYHMRVISLDGSDRNQDRALQAPSVVVPPPACALTGPEIVCAESLNTCTVLTDVPADGLTYLWALANNTADATFVGPTNGPTVQVSAGRGGHYSLQVVLQVAEVSSTCARDVQVLSLTTAAPLADQTVCPRGTVVLSTAPAGSGPFHFVWRKDGQAIPGATNDALALTNVSSADAGFYCVEVTGACNSVSPCATITVEPLPVMVCPDEIARECLSEVPPPDPTAILTSGGSGAVTVRHAGDLVVTNGPGFLISRRYAATDACGSETSCSQIIHVQDLTLPLIACPADLTVAEEPAGSGAARVVFPLPAASDNCAPPPSVACQPATGETLPVGEHEVTCIATDPAGNAASCMFRVSVVPFTIVANSTADSGPGTLRQALLDANAAPGPNTLHFDFPGPAPYVIHLLSPLPAIQDEVVIDGWSQITFTGTPVVELDGTDAGTAASSREAAAPGGPDGLVIQAGNTTVRGLVLNGFHTGIRVLGPGGNVLEGNLIGVDGSGPSAVGNSGDGILIASPGNRVGGRDSASANIISGNSGSGIRLESPEATGNLIQGNLIGTARDGITPLGNGLDGVTLGSHAASNTIGRGNVIAFNGRHGVALESSAGTGNAIRGNSIADNAGLGIDLGADGPTPNDPGDADTGPNNLQNAPTLQSVQSDGRGKTTLAGHVRGAAHTQLLVEFFLNRSTDEPSAAEGRTRLEETLLAVDASGEAMFFVTLPMALASDELVTATATDPAGNTSEFGQPVAVVAPPFIVTPPAATSADPGGPATLCVEAVGSQPLFFQWRRNGANMSDATNACYTIPSAQLSDGGTYTVVVANDHGVVTSDPVALTLLLAQVAPGDNYAERVRLVRTNGVVAGSNLTATFEPGEPLHAAKPGGKSIWYAWTAPADGVATFRTVGSTFDTLLAVYAGTSVSTLVPVASDEDRGGFYTSGLRFNAAAGTDYAIAIDGFGGAEGEFVFSWNLEVNTEPLPVITLQPAGQTVAPGGTATFRVTTLASCRDGHHQCRHPDKDHHSHHKNDQAQLRYQWYRNGQAIPGATNATLTVANVQPDQLGNYTVLVREGTASVESLPASLQVNLTGPAVQPVQAADKFLDAALAPTQIRLGTPRPGSFTTAQPSANPDVVPVSLVRGYTGTQVFNTAGSSTEGEIICDVVGGASEWIPFVTEESGELHMDTQGSSFDTVIAVFRRAPSGRLEQVDCNDNASAAVRSSAVNVQVTAGQTNYLVVDGVGGATGTLRLNYSLVTSSVLTSLGKTPGGAHQLRVSGHPDMRFTIETSMDFLDWVPLFTTNSVFEALDFDDPNMAGAARRFYRARMLP